MKIHESVVDLSFIFPHPPDDKKQMDMFEVQQYRADIILCNSLNSCPKLYLSDVNCVRCVVKRSHCPC